MNKKKILLCWGYNRRNWIESFESLNDQFDFVYLFYLEKSQETEIHTKNPILYYTDYKTPKELLNKIKPFKVVFMGLDGLVAIALNVQCQKDEISTYYMAHGGATLSMEDYLSVDYDKRSLFKDSLTRQFGLWLYTLRFLCAGLGLKYIKELPTLLKYQFDKTRMHGIFAMQKNKTFLRIPSGYILFAEEAKDFFVDLDNADRSIMHVIGNLEIDYYINLSPKYDEIIGNYILYLETPLSKIENNAFDINLLEKEEYNELIGAMNTYAKTLGMKLVIKLHPYSFANTYLLQDDNIIYKKDTVKEQLIMNCSGIIFYNSSLAIPALYFKTGLMFTIDKLDDFQKKIKKCNCCYIYDYKTLMYSPEQIKFLKEEMNFDKTAFISTYVGEGADGNGLQRLAKILNA